MAPSDKPLRGLQWAPSHEQEVVLLFGLLLPYIDGVLFIEEASDSFPDCIAVDDRGRPVRIEFEVLASSFLAHGHDPKGCDLIVCWQNDWPDSPVPVLELKQVVLQRAPWAVQHPERRKAHEGAWDEAEFLAHANEAGAAMLQGVKAIISQHSDVFAAVQGKGDQEATLGVWLLRGGKGRIYTIFGRGFVDVDFTRLKSEPLREELRRRLASVGGQGALTKSWTRLSAREPWQREVLLEALRWLGEALTAPM